jgi:hypothetical protein
MEICIPSLRTELFLKEKSFNLVLGKEPEEMYLISGSVPRQLLVTKLLMNRSNTNQNNFG